MIRAVFDANVLASGFVGLSRTGVSAPAVLLRSWMLGRFTLIVSEEILAEVEQSAFSKPYFQRALPAEARARAFAVLRRNALIVDLTETAPGIAPDPDDDHVLAAALSAQTGYLVTGDRALRALGSHAGVRLVTPREFLEMIETEADVSDEDAG
ncbi:putative toxin-antitoxin system toxin component, PIN family [soil metagenome]